MIILNHIEDKPLAPTLKPLAIDQDGFGKLFEQNKNLVFKTAYLMLDNEAEAEEALQEVFILVYRSFASFDPGKGAITTWLHRVTINYCLGHMRKRRVTVQPLEDDLPLPSSSSVDANPALLVERNAVRQVVRGLNPKQRAVVILRYFWDMPYNEIANILDIPLGTVKSRIVLALRALRQKLEGQGDTR